MLHNPIFLAMWMNGMVYVNRMDSKSRKDAITKMKRIISEGSSVVLFPEGGYNNTENQLIQPLFSSPYILSKDMEVEIVPIITFNESDSNIIYVRVGEPMNLSNYDKYEAMQLLRDEMSTILYQIIEEHTFLLKRMNLSKNPRMDWLEERKKVYDCQKWYKDVWDEEVTFYPGHNVITPKQSREFLDKVCVNGRNAYIYADMLVRREEDNKYDLKKYLRKNMKYAK